MKIFKTISSIIAAVALATLIGCASDAKKEGAGRVIDDSVITTKVKAAVLKEPTLKSSEINVETYKGVVQLSGFVNSEADIQKAVEVARGVKGVSSVKNDMRLKPN
ncbi:MAG TPA: BON domain-containing protein [Methylotenera sp.]|nr:BON domain-containing protein [Methylotenera sp.]